MSDKSLHGRETIRRTLEMTKEATENLSRVSKALRISQPALVSEIFESLREDDPVLQGYADKYRDVAGELRRKQNELLARLENLGSEKLDELLKQLEAQG